jgi:uncharacterized protein with HEPN domain
MIKDHLVYFLRIRDAIGKIEQFTSGGQSEFLSEPMVQDGVILNLALIGEAVKHISKTVTAQYPEIAWSDAAKMRDILVHHYDGTDVQIVWETVERYLPPLKKVVTKALKTRVSPNP